MGEVQSNAAPRSLRSISLLVLGFLLAGTQVWAAPEVRQTGPDLYAYISDNDSSSNSTFLVGRKGILVVDTGLNAVEGGKLLQAIRKISYLPVLYIVNTHYHPDHQGGNAAVGPSAVVVSTDWTRERTLAVMQSAPALGASFRPAQVTFQQGLTVYLDPYTVEVYFPGKAHTSGDALVYFPRQRTIAMGDLFLNRSSPAMDDGSAENWIKALGAVLQKPLDAVVPGHFELASRVELQRFRDYLHDLFSQVQALSGKGATQAEVRRGIHMEKYSDFRQYPQFQATFADNAESIYQQLKPH
ncbi:MAG TPA: MBL fold metallo-hydrolase [Terriglobales bacterium]|jgi:cyclase|nr:MBL fold metallo-hydrolase [Terriglobales bacterium]